MELLSYSDVLCMQYLQIVHFAFAQLYCFTPQYKISPGELRNLVAKHMWSFRNAFVLDSNPLVCAWRSGMLRTIFSDSPSSILAFSRNHCVSPRNIKRLFLGVTVASTEIQCFDLTRQVASQSESRDSKTQCNVIIPPDNIDFPG